MKFEIFLISVMAFLVGSILALIAIESGQPLQQDYANLLKGADKNIDIAHHIDIHPINSTEHPFSIKSIKLNPDDSISIDFGGVHENFMTIPDFDYTRTFQINDSFIFYCMPSESGYPSLGIYKYLGIHEIDEHSPSFIFYHGDGTSQNKFECKYPEIIEKSVNLFHFFKSSLPILSE